MKQHGDLKIRRGSSAQKPGAKPWLRSPRLVGSYPIEKSGLLLLLVSKWKEKPPGNHHCFKQKMLRIRSVEKTFSDTQNIAVHNLLVIV